ncbi:MAG: hypothetical protein WA198_15965 [Candidatus Sulfotelmatobacter sp.]
MIVAAVTIAVQLRKQAPPEVARLLPGGDAFFYVNLGRIRRVTGGKTLPAVSHDPEYERFISQTGFEFERDLDEAAFAVHYPGNWPGGGTGESAPEPRFSEVLKGEFHGERLSAYLRQIAQAVENYQSIDIYTLRIQGRSVRVAVLNADLVAASNHDDPAVIRGIVDRSKRLASPFGGPALLRQFYKHVQLASLAWVVARIDPAALGESSWSSLFTAPATLVVSGSYLSALHLNLKVDSVHVRAEAFTSSPEEARAIIDKVNVFLALTHTGETAVGMHGTDPDVKAFFDSIAARQADDRAVVNASLPFGFLRKMLAESGPEVPQATPPPAQPAAKSR